MFDEDDDAKGQHDTTEPASEGVGGPPTNPPKWAARTDDVYATWDATDLTDWEVAAAENRGGDATRWLVVCDWLAEQEDGGAVADAIRAAVNAP